MREHDTTVSEERVADLVTNELDRYHPIKCAPLHRDDKGVEKAIAPHLTLFATVAAHYQAVPINPRIILLDEVFVGVESNNRGQVFALPSASDL